MKNYFNEKKSASLFQEAKAAEYAVNSTFTYFAKMKLNPTAQECEDMLLDADGIRAFVFDNRFENYIRVAYNGSFIPESRIAEEKKAFNQYYNFSGFMEFYNRYTRFKGNVSWIAKDGTTGSYELNKEELEAFIKGQCTFELSDTILSEMEYIKRHTDALNSGFNPLYDGYIMKGTDGKYTCDVDKYILDNQPR